MLQIYRWKPAEAPEPFTQVFGLVLTNDHGLLEINGATLQSLQEQALPAFDSIVRSIRFIPAGADASSRPSGPAGVCQSSG